MMAHPNEGARDRFGNPLRCGDTVTDALDRHWLLTGRVSETTEGIEYVEAFDAELGVRWLVACLTATSGRCDA